MKVSRWKQNDDKKVHFDKTEFCGILKIAWSYYFHFFHDSIGADIIFPSSFILYLRNRRIPFRRFFPCVFLRIQKLSGLYV